MERYGRGAGNRQRGRRVALLASLAASSGCVGALALGGCSGHHDAVAPPDSAVPEDAGAEGSDAGSDAGMAAGDAHAEADAGAPVVTGLAIVSATGAPLQGAPGDAVPLAVVLEISDGTTRPVAADQVTWQAPQTLSAEDPNDAGPDLLPEAGAQPTAFFVHDAYRSDNRGVLYVVDPGTVSAPTVTVTASVADAGAVSTTVSILPAPIGDAASGALLFLHGPECGTCHGPTGGGSLPALTADGGPILIDGGPAYAISGELYPYPAPGLNNAPDSGNLASDPAWNAALLGMAAQADMDNQGVALRAPMPDWFGGTNATGGTLGAQDFADIYAWLKTQTK